VSENVAQFMLKRLREWGVKRFYGYPGDGINAVTSSIVALRRSALGILTRRHPLEAYSARSVCKDRGITMRFKPAPILPARRRLRSAEHETLVRGIL
jgi:hypothetical protein